MEISDWENCYSRGWGEELVPEAYSHPAKVSFKLAERIYFHVIECDWVHEGETVLDPFGGIAGFAYHAMKHGLNFVGIELEQKFVTLGNANITLWNSRYAGRFARWGTARLVQGDSRRLLEVIRSAGIVVSSPPFGEAQTGGGISAAMRGEKSYPMDNLPGNLYQPSEHGLTPGNLGNLRADEKGFAAAVGSPPYIDRVSNDSQRTAQTGQPLTQMNEGDGQTYGSTVGQLGAMREGELDAAISSPPYADGARQQGTDLHPELMEGGEFHPARYDLSVTSPPFLQTSGGTNTTSESGPLADARLIARHATGNAAAGYGDDAASLSNLPEGDIAQVVSSPPYEEGLGHNMRKVRPIDVKKSLHMAGGSLAYGESDGQLAQEQGDTFWSAARLIVAETYAALRPGGHAVWVVKSFVRNKAIVDFPGQWRALCESVGFTTLHEHHALLVEDHGTQTALDGNHKRHVKERKSFFRRLAEKKGSPHIDYEVVLCMVKA